MRFTVAAILVAGAAAFAPVQQPAARTSTSLNMADILKKTTGQAALDPSVVAQYASLALPTDKGELVLVGTQLNRSAHACMCTLGHTRTHMRMRMGLKQNV